MRRLRYAVLVTGLLASVTVGIASARSEEPQCSNLPTAGTELRSPYAPDPVASTLGATWVAAEQPGDAPLSYLLYVPQDLPTGPTPVVMTIHGLLGNAKQHLAQTGWREVADEHGFIVVAPNGMRHWDTNQDSADVAFLRDVIADVRSLRCVDERRIYVTGHSNGAFMTHRLACESGDLFAAGASYAAGDIANFPSGSPCAADGVGDPLPGYESVPLGMWHGDDDAIVAYAAGRRGMWSWLDRYGCDTSPLVEDVAFGTRETYRGCTAGPFEVVFRRLSGHGHAWPDGCGGQQSTGGSVECEPAPGTGPWPEATDLTEELWSYLAQHARTLPAVAQAAPTIDPPRSPRTDDLGPWADAGVGSGMDSEATFGRTAPLVAAADELRVSLLLRVATGGDGAGVGPSHPVCPTANPGPSTQSMPDRRVSVSALDLAGTVRTVDVTTEPVVVTRPDGVVEHVEQVDAVLPGAFNPTATIIRARYAGDPLKFWWSCGTPRAIYKETFPAPSS